MSVTILNNDGSTRKVFATVKDMFDDMELKRKNRTKIQILHNFIVYILWEHRLKEWLTPSSLIRKSKWLYQRITRGWDETDLWSLDCAFAKWCSNKLKLLDQTDTIKRCIQLLDYKSSDESSSNYDNMYMMDCLYTIIDIYFTNKAFQQDVQKWIIPRLIEFKKNKHGYPSELNNYDEWYDILNNIIDGFVINDLEQLKLFVKYFDNLWL